MPKELESVLSIIFTLVMIVLVFVGAYFASKFIGGYYQKTNSRGKSRIDLIEKKMIAKDQSLLIVKIEDKVFLLGATPHNISKIEELDLEISDQEESQPLVPPNFLDVLKGMIKKKDDEDKL